MLVKNGAKCTEGLDSQDFSKGKEALVSGLGNVILQPMCKVQGCNTLSGDLQDTITGVADKTMGNLNLQRRKSMWSENFIHQLDGDITERVG